LPPAFGSREHAPAAGRPPGLLRPDREFAGRDLSATGRARSLAQIVRAGEGFAATGRALFAPRQRKTERATGHAISGRETKAVDMSAVECWSAGELEWWSGAHLDAAHSTTPILQHRSEEHTSELQSLRHLVCR